MPTWRSVDSRRTGFGRRACLLPGRRHDGQVSTTRSRRPPLPTITRSPTSIPIGNTVGGESPYEQNIQPNPEPFASYLTRGRRRLHQAGRQCELLAIGSDAVLRIELIGTRNHSCGRVQLAGERLFDQGVRDQSIQYRRVYYRTKRWQHDAGNFIGAMSGTIAFGNNQYGISNPTGTVSFGH